MYSASVPLNSTLFVTGGIDNDSNLLDSTEMITIDGTVSAGPKLSSPRSYHCMVKLSTGNIMLLGGYPAEENGKMVNIFNPVTETFTNSSPLK